MPYPTACFLTFPLPVRLTLHSTALPSLGLACRYQSPTPYFRSSYSVTPTSHPFSPLSLALKPNNPSSRAPAVDRVRPLLTVLHLPPPWPHILLAHGGHHYIHIHAPLASFSLEILPLAKSSAPCTYLAERDQRSTHSHTDWSCLQSTTSNFQCTILLPLSGLLALSYLANFYFFFSSNFSHIHPQLVILSCYLTEKIEAIRRGLAHTATIKSTLHLYLCPLLKSNTKQRPDLKIPRADETI